MIDDTYIPIEPVNGRLPSEVLGLHLERDGKRLRLYNPATGARLPTAVERIELAQRLADTADASLRLLAEENERLRREIESLRRG